VVQTFLIAAALVLGQVEAETKAKAADAKAAEAKAEAVAKAEEKAPAVDLAAKVKQLVRQLDAPQQAQREAAEKELVALGGEILPLLPGITDRTPAEMKVRLARIRGAVTKVAVAATVKTALVSLSGEMPVSKAFDELTKQSGNALVDYRERRSQEERDPMIKVDLKEVPFWQALDTVLDAAELSLDNYDEETGALAYVARGEGMLPRVGRASYAGLFRLEPTRIEAVRDLRNTENRSLRLFLDATWEPRVQPIVLEQSLDEVSATDEAGNAVLIDGSEGKLEVPVESHNAGVELSIPFQAPDRSVKQLASIKGKMTALVLGKVESFEFADIDKQKASELTRGGATVVVDSCRKNGDIYEVNMRVAFDKTSNALDSHRGWIYNNECFMLDPKDNRIENVGVEATLLADNSVGLSYKFDLGDDVKPAKHTFVYKTAAAIIPVPVEFELKGIDLP
jgi:hypothetical protein